MSLPLHTPRPLHKLGLPPWPPISQPPVPQAVSKVTSSAVSLRLVTQDLPPLKSGIVPKSRSQDISKARLEQATEVSLSIKCR